MGDMAEQFEDCPEDREDPFYRYEAEPAEVLAVLVRETEKALCIRQGKTETWISRSLCHYISKTPKDKRGVVYLKIEMPYWLVVEKELEYE